MFRLFFLLDKFQPLLNLFNGRILRLSIGEFSFFFGLIGFGLYNIGLVASYCVVSLAVHVFCG